MIRVRHDDHRVLSQRRGSSDCGSAWHATSTTFKSSKFSGARSARDRAAAASSQYSRLAWGLILSAAPARGGCVRRMMPRAVTARVAGPGGGPGAHRLPVAVIRPYCQAGHGAAVITLLSPCADGVAPCV